MLSAKELIESREKPAIDVPSFGAKDFIPNGSFEQSAEVQTALMEIKTVISQERVKLLHTLSHAIWQPELQLAEVTQHIGSQWSYMGHKRGQKLYIYPEETLYLLETGSLQLLFNEVPLSVQRAYFVLFGSESNITIEKYRVYSLLSSYGYKVLRHSPQKTVTKYEKQLEVHKLGLKLKDFHSLTTAEKRPQDSENSFKGIKKLKINDTKVFPVTCEEDVHSTEIPKKAQIISTYDNTVETNLNFDYDVFSETLGQSFKKSCLQLPNFRVIIHRSEDSFFDVEEFCKLSQKYKDEVPVIHAIVFFDSITFYRMDPVVLPNS